MLEMTHPLCIQTTLHRAQPVQDITFIATTGNEKGVSKT